jgi:hypothetical protein
MRSNTRRSTAVRPQYRIWEYLWEEDSNLHFGEIKVSVFIMEPEIIAEKAGIPPACPRYLVPKLAA